MPSRFGEKIDQCRLSSRPRPPARDGDEGEKARASRRPRSGSGVSQAGFKRIQEAFRSLKRDRPKPSPFVRPLPRRSHGSHLARTMNTPLRADLQPTKPHAGRRSHAPGSGPTVDLFGRKLRLPRSRPLRIALGVALCIGGVLGFLPILGFWMIPLGLIVLSVDIAPVRRFRRRLAVRWENRRRRKREARSGG